MYKKRIKDWNLKKNHREKDVRAIFRKQIQRSAVGKSSVFILDGQTVDLTAVLRKLKRKGVKAEDVTSSRSATPVGLLCFTPEPGSRPMSRGESMEVQCHSYTVGTSSDIGCFTPKSDTRSEHEFLSSFCSHIATRTLSVSPPVGIRVDTPRSTGIRRDVFQEVCIDPRELEFPGIRGRVFQEVCIGPRVLEVPGTYQSVTSYRPAFSPFEWYPAWLEYGSKSIYRDVSVHPLVEALRSLIIPIDTYEDLKCLDQKWGSIKRKLKEIFKNDAQTNKHLFKPSHLGRHPPHILDTSSMNNMMIDARKNLVTTRKYLSLYLHQLHCSLCRPKLSMDFEDGKECYPISVTAEAVLNLQGASLPEVLHYCWCIFGSISLANSNYQYRSFTRTLFPLLVQEFSLGTLAGKSVCIDIAWCNIQWRKIGKAIAILKQIFGQDFGFILWLSQLRDNAHVVLDRPGWNEKQSFEFGPYWSFSITPRIQYRKAVTILQWIRDHDTRSWDGILVEEFSHGYSEDYFLQRLIYGFDVWMMRPAQPPESTSEEEWPRQACGPESGLS